MGERTAYVPGTFCWADLGPSDPVGATSFYGALFGWEPVDMPAGEGMTYTMLASGVAAWAPSTTPIPIRDAGVALVRVGGERGRHRGARPQGAASGLFEGRIDP